MRTQVFKKSLIYIKDILALIIDFIDLRGNKFLQKKEMLLAFFDKKLSYLNLNKKCLFIQRWKRILEWLNFIFIN